MAAHGPRFVRRRIRESHHRLVDEMAARRLRESIFFTASQAFLLADARRPDYPIIDVSPAFERLTGYRREEILGWNCRFLQGADTDPGAVARMSAALRAGAGLSLTLLNYRKNGTPFWNSLSITPIRDELGVITHYLGVQADATDQVRAHELETALAAERESNRLKGQFLAMMSHELRTPMSAIVGYASLLLDNARDPLTPDQRLDVQQIARGADHLLDLINDVLDLARIEANRMPMTIEPVLIADEIADVLAEFRSLIEAKALALDTIVRPATLTVDADPLRLRQILVNLVSNAVKFTPTGQITIRAEQRGGNVSIAVQDSGIGIAGTVLPRIFERFIQADSSTTRVYGGAGLGLTIARRLAELHGGAIEVASTEGVGSRFTLVLPATNTWHPADPREERPGQPAPDY